MVGDGLLVYSNDEYAPLELLDDYIKKKRSCLVVVI